MTEPSAPDDSERMPAELAYESSGMGFLPLGTKKKYKKIVR
jgi:hypothetical protein